MRLAALLLVTALAGSLHAQTPGISQSLRKTEGRIVLSDLPESYRAVRLNASGDPFFSLLGAATDTDAAGSVQQRTILSALGATWVDPDEFEAFLDGRHPRLRALRLDRTGLTDLEPGANEGPGFTETWLESGGVTDWSPLPGLSRKDLQRLFPSSPFGTQTLPAGYVEHVADAKAITKAILGYLRDHDNRFFRADSTSQAKSQVAGYLPKSSTWPDRYPDGRRLLFNTGLSGKIVADLGYPSNLLLLFEDRPGPDGRYAVAFVNGESRLVDKDEWRDLRKDAQARARQTPKKGKGRL